MDDGTEHPAFVLNETEDEYEVALVTQEDFLILFFERFTNRERGRRHILHVVPEDL